MGPGLTDTIGFVELLWVVICAAGMLVRAALVGICLAERDAIAHIPDPHRRDLATAVVRDKLRAEVIHVIVKGLWLTIGAIVLLLPGRLDTLTDWQRQIAAFSTAYTPLALLIAVSLLTLDGLIELVTYRYLFARVYSGGSNG